MPDKWKNSKDVSADAAKIERCPGGFDVEIETVDNRVSAVTLMGRDTRVTYRIGKAGAYTEHLSLLVPDVEMVNVWRVSGTVWGQKLDMRFPEEHQARETHRKFTEEWGDGVAKLKVEQASVPKGGTLITDDDNDDDDDIPF